MITSNERRAAMAGILGSMFWLFAFFGFTLGEIEYQDPSQVSPIPEWASALALSIGAALIGTMLLRMRADDAEGGLVKAGIVVAIAGTALALIPLWPMIFFGPLLVGLGMAARGLATIRRGNANGASWLHAVGVPVGMASGMGFEALGSDGIYSTYVFALALCGGLIWLGYDMIARDRHPAPLTTQVDM